MTEEQLINLWVVLGGGSLVLLFVGALTDRVTVYRDYTDLGWSLSLIFTPIVSVFLVTFIANDQADPWVFATEVLVGQVILATTAIILGWSTLSTYRMSIEDNGLTLGIFVGTAKLLIAIIISFCAISLVKYLFRDKRKLGHVAIFFILFGIFGWILKVLINGARTGKAIQIRKMNI